MRYKIPCRQYPAAVNLQISCRWFTTVKGSGWGQSRRFDDVRDVSASPSAAAEPVHHGEPARYAPTGNPVPIVGMVAPTD